LQRANGEDSYSARTEKLRGAIRRGSPDVLATLENKAFAAFMCNENACAWECV
jgi:hypothetical protein